MHRSATILLFLLLIPAGAHATTRLVLPDGTGEWATVQGAASASVNGDTILLGSGVFAGNGEFRLLDYTGKSIVVRSVTGDPADCIIDNWRSAVGCYSNEGPGAVLEGVTLQNCELAFYIHDSDPTIRNCVFRDNHDTVGYGAAIWIRMGGDPLIEDCLFLNNQAYHGGGVAQDLGGSPVIRRCVFRGNEANGDGGAIAARMSQAIIENCTFVGNRASRGSVIYANYYASPVLDRCVLFGNLDSTPVSYWADATLQLISCNIYGNEAGDWVDEISGQLDLDANFSAPPLFCDPDAGDFHLCADSPNLPENNLWGCDQLVGALGAGCDDCTPGPAAESCQNVSLVGAFVTGSPVLDVEVIGNVIYLADGGSGLRILDVSDPAQPVPLSVVDTHWAMAVTVRDGMAYVADEWAGLKIFDVSDPAAPVLVGELDTAGLACDVALQGDLALVADLDGLRVVNVAEPSSPWETGFLFTSGPCRGVAARDGLVLVAEAYRGLRAVDLTGYGVPETLGYLELEGHARKVRVRGDLAFVACEEGGLRIVNITDPENLQEVGNHLAPAVCDVKLDGFYAHLADGAGGLRMINIENPINPVEQGYYQPAGQMTGVGAGGGNIFLAREAGGVLVLRNELIPTPAPLAPQAGLQLRNYPNPFNPSTRIEFRLEEPGPVTVRVYDARGRLVRQLAGGEVMGAGVQTVQWDGKDQAGRGVAAGAYLCEVGVGEQRSMSRMVLVR